MSLLRPVLLAAVALVVSARAADSQTPVWTVGGRNVHDVLGTGLSITADFDGDGIPDILAGAPGLVPATAPGYVRVIGSVSGNDLVDIASDQIGDGFGSSVATLGDVDGDGVVDLLVGRPFASGSGSLETGAVQIRSGATKAILLEVLGPGAYSYFGSVVVAPGDLDGDGIPDFAVGGGGHFAAVYAYSGASGASIWQSQAGNGSFGTALAPIGDFDGDGVPDLLVGSPYDTTLGGVGSAYVVSGATGLVLQGFIGAGYGEDGFGSVVASAGDVDGDGVPDVLVGDPYYTTSGWSDNYRGEAVLISGATGAALFREIGTSDYEFFGGLLAGCADFDGDGVPDFATGKLGYLDLWSGRTRTFLRKLDPHLEIQRVIPLPDLDGDGVPDFAGSDPYAPDWSKPYIFAGVVLSFRGTDAKGIRARTGQAIDEKLGAAVAAFADIDGDGWRDVLVGVPAEPNYYSGTEHAAEVRILSGRDGSVLRVNASGRTDDGYGSAIVVVPDLDSDGTPDYAIASPYVPYGAPCVDVRSGASGSQLLTLNQLGMGFTISLAAGRDASGRTVLAVGDWYLGSVHLFDLKSGAHITSFVGEFASNFGQSVAALGDVDADGINDWIVGAPYSKHSAPDGGTAIILSGASGAELGRIDGTALDHVGYAVAAIDDLDGDGILDALVGAPTAGNGGKGGNGAVVAVSGANAAPLLAVTGSEPNGGLGGLVAALGDVNRDGVADFATKQSVLDGSSGQYVREIVVFSSATRGILARIRASAVGEASPQTIASLVGDFTFGVDPDAIPDLLVGDPGGPAGGGAAALIRLDDLLLQATPSVVAGGQPIELDTRGGPPGNLVALALTAFDATPLFLLAATGTFDLDGIWTVNGTVPPGLTGHTATLRAFAIGFSGGVVDSSDVVLTFQ